MGYRLAQGFCYESVQAHAMLCRSNHDPHMQLRSYPHVERALERFLRFASQFGACSQIILLRFMKCGFQGIGILSFVTCQSPNEFDLALNNPVVGIAVHRNNLPIYA